MDKIGTYTVSQVIKKIKNKKGGKKGIVPLSNNENFILKKIGKYNGNTKMGTVLREIRFRSANHPELVNSLKKLFNVHNMKKHFKKTVSTKKKTTVRIKPVNKTLHTIKENMAYY